MSNLERNVFTHQEVEGSLVDEYKTLDKVRNTIIGLGWSEYQTEEVINALQNAGIIFKESK